jgi:integrase
MHFKKFVNKKSIAPIEITEELCKRFRAYLLDHLNGETPMNYFVEFKRTVKSATKQGYFRENPTEDVKSKKGKNQRLKAILEVDEYLKLLNTPCLNEEVREAFIFCCYTGLRWVDVKALTWFDIGPDSIRTRLIQAKTGEPVVITMHPISKAILDKRRARYNGVDHAKAIFKLPTADGANKLLKQWVRSAEINKSVTWSVARLSFSILLQERMVDTATVALLLGHRTTKYVNDTYKRYRPKDQTEVIAKLPSPNEN